MVKFCDKCGAELKNENAKFCQECGVEVKTSQNQNAGTNFTGSVCPHCGQNTPIGQPNCVNCGAPIVEENNTIAVIIGYIVTFIFGVIGIIPAIYLLTRKNGKAKTQGLVLIVISIVWIFIRLIFRSWLAYLLIFIIMIGGIVLWVKDYSIT